MATGKSTVSNMLRELGIPVIDADAMARRIVEPGRKAWKAIRAEFGQHVFHDNGELNRAALRTIIFEVGFASIKEVFTVTPLRMKSRDRNSTGSPIPRYTRR